MSPRPIVLTLACTVLLTGAGPAAHATGSGEPDISVSIEKHARPTTDGGLAFRVHVVCGPLPGSPDVREGLAGAGQSKTGASAEGGLSPDVVCDGVERVHTAGVSPITDERFRRGPAEAGATVVACNTVGDGQVCVQESAQRRVVVRGRAV